MKKLLIGLSLSSFMFAGVAHADDFSGGLCTQPHSPVYTNYCKVYGPGGTYDKIYGKGGLYCIKYGYNC